MPADHDQRIARKRRREILIGRHVANPLVRALNKAGLLPKSTVELETVGRKSGQKRVVPVTANVDADRRGAWVISQHGTHSGWAHNVEADPNVRLKYRGEWLAGKARLVPEDDVVARVKTFSKTDQAGLNALKTTPISVRIDFE
ncbi:MAG: nitroreductase family deazaflavin-dependent oxidoreductase [Segniliparus sp.]|uniref:nitroreductase family deazaflavin-dependent oxidoreductase n=1 Tax=Segniliparus sp. TaxID=2804064 RepID=UPI003F305887